MLSGTVFYFFKMKQCHMRFHGSGTASILILIPFFLISLTSAISAQAGDIPLYLNEIMASNGSSIADEDGDNEDWIEIFYDGEEPLNLGGYYLSDDYDEPRMWEFPDITIQPGQFLLVWASNKDRRDPESELHTNFAIAAAGEEVILTAPDGERLDELEPTEIPTDISFGRYPDGTGDWYFYTNPTPGEPNGDDGYQEMLEPVTFSHEGGFYTSDFELELSHPDPDVTIIYTLDGSEPDPNNLDGTTYQHALRYRPADTLVEKTYQSNVYSADSTLIISDRTNEPNYFSRMQTTRSATANPYYFPDESVFKGTLVRARAVRSGAISDGIQTHSYFVTSESRDRHTLPVISLGIQEDHLFCFENGIYVAGKEYTTTNPYNDSGHAHANYSESWERPASMELFEHQSSYSNHSQDIGVRIHGNISRAHPMKSLRLYARNEYSDNRIFYPMFPDEPYNEYNRLILRNSGNDWRNTMFRDAMMQRIVGHMNFDTQAYRPFIIYINGEYWGIHNLRERYDKHYLARVHGVDPDNIDLLEHDALIKEGDNQHYNRMRNYIERNRLVEEEHYAHIKTQMDVENFIDYQIAQIFVTNTDWPGNNIDFWRKRTDQFDPDAPPQHDGRWRWLVYDLDFGFNRSSTATVVHNTLEFALAEHGPHWPNPEWSTFLFRKLMQNKSFKMDFINRYLDQLNTAFLPARVVGIITEMAAHIEPEFDEHIRRWSAGNLDEVGNVLIPFAEERPDYARQHLREYFDIAVEHELTVDVSDRATGHIRVNTIDITPETPGVDDKPYPWTGTYFQDVPVTLKAEPVPGFKFAHWEGVADSIQFQQKLEMNLSGNTSITAVFERDINPDAFPGAFRLRPESEVISFDRWAHDAEPGSFPDHMAFVYMDALDPGLEANISGFTGGSYTLDRRTRINGLGDDGFAFINTGSEDGNPGYPGTRLGGAILALNTRGAENIQISWEGMTVEPNSRVYNLRLQYRIGHSGPFTDIPDSNGEPVEYQRNEDAGHRATIGPAMLPEEAENQYYVQLFWRYYFTGERLDEESGQRTQLAIPFIEADALDVVSARDTDEERPSSFKLRQNYPNPFNPSTTIRFDLPETSDVRLEVFDMLGRRVTTLVDEQRSAGSHTVRFDATGLTSGLYIYRIIVGEHEITRKMTLVK